MRVVFGRLASAALFLLTGSALAQPPALLPQPRSVEAGGQGEFSIESGTTIASASDPGARNAAERFAELLRRTGGIELPAGQAGAIRFVRAPGMSKEAYRLEVTPQGATVTASDDAGLFYGGVTLWQLASKGDAIPAVTIEDSPRYGWRGLMLDSARHFQSPELVKRLIDWMAAHKLNMLHWHLTDDQGWRIEIDKYPRLTEVGAWRVPASAPGAPPLPRTGGYYTKTQIREIVAYAAERSISIVPEIDVPGHALSAIRAYPKLGTGVTPPPGIESDWGVFPYLYNVEEETFGFLEDVLAEVIELFPGRFIHLGGDEAVKDQWKTSSEVQARMKALGIEDEAELQSWFIGRLGRWLEGKGRRLIGWDEILEGGLPQGATVMSWRGIEGAVAAAKAGHDTVLSPAPVLYFDHRQGGGPAEPPGRGKIITLADVYAFDPAPASLTAQQQRHILGLQANLWTEHVRTEERAAHMMFPRAAAVAELGWSTKRSGFDDFVDRLLPQLDRLAPLGLEAAPSAFRVTASAWLAEGRVTVTLANQIGSEIRYTLDGSDPGPESSLYSGPLMLELPARLRAAGVRKGRALPGAFNKSFDARSVRRRDDTQLRLCTDKLVLSLEDDAPTKGQRAVFLTDIINPCWLYEAAPLDGVSAIEVDVGQIPFNFQIGKDIEAIKFRPPATPAGEIEVRIGGCEGERIAVLPLAPALANPGVTTLRAAIPPRTGAHHLCFTYTANGPEPSMWAIDAVQLVTAQ